MAEESKSYGLAWFLAGLGVGALVGILYAPKSGKETREDIASGARESAEYLRARTREAAENVSAIVDRGKEQVNAFVDRGKEQVGEYVDRGRAQWEEFVERGKKSRSPISPPASPPQLMRAVRHTSLRVESRKRTSSKDRQFHRVPARPRCSSVFSSTNSG